MRCIVGFPLFVPYIELGVVAFILKIGNIVASADIAAESVKVAWVNWLSVEGKTEVKAKA
jgi:hypothetical protein